ncbi:MAG: caspase family protein [Ferruginibacter sp.]
MLKPFSFICFLFILSNGLFAQSEYFKSPVKINIVKLEVDTANPYHNINVQRFQSGAVLREGDKFKIEIINSGNKTYYYSLWDIQPDNQINVLLPDRNNPQDFFINQHDTEKLNNFIFTITPPYGVDKFLLVVTEDPLIGISSGFINMENREHGLQEITWILQGQPSAIWKGCFFSVMDIAIIPKDDYKNTGYINKNSTGLADYHNYNFASLKILDEERCIHKIKDLQNLYVVYPLISFIQPLQAGATRGVIVEHKAENKKFVLKGFASAFKGIKEVLVNGEKGDITILTEQQFSWEKEVSLKIGKNDFTVSVITNDGKENCEKVIMVYNEKDKTVEKEGHNYSLFVGINNYKNYNKLTGARKDATDMKKLLQELYQFDPEYTSELYDEQATKDNIDSVFRYLINKLTPADNLLVYFAGHGVLDKQINEGYWIPVEARSHKPLDYLANGEIKKYLEAMNARHVAVFADACFSGGFFKTNRGETYAEKVDQLRSKWLFCSGREEEVSDVMAGQQNSPFAYFLMKFLKEYKGNALTTSELAQQVKTAVTSNSNQTPISGAIRDTGDEGGEFVFRKRSKSNN